MKKIFVFTICILSFFNIYSQKTVERTKAISIIEDLTYNEYYLDSKCYDKLKINYDDTSSKVEFIYTSYLGEDNNTVSKTIFYLSDLDLSNFTVEKQEISDGLFLCQISIKAKSKSVTSNIVTINKSKFKYPDSKTNYLDDFIFFNFKALPQSLNDKLINNFEILLGIKKQ